MKETEKKKPIRPQDLKVLGLNKIQSLKNVLLKI
jgi:hypothetical protein